MQERVLRLIAALANDFTLHEKSLFGAHRFRSILMRQVKDTVPALVITLLVREAGIAALLSSVG